MVTESQHRKFKRLNEINMKRIRKDLDYPVNEKKELTLAQKLERGLITKKEFKKRINSAFQKKDIFA